jgi:hypothetical protein
VIVTAVVIAAVGGFVSGGLLGRVRSRHNKLDAEGYDALPPKTPPDKMPGTYKKGSGYRDAGLEPMTCQRCKRNCIYCRKEERRKKRRWFG